ncbi:hypothetical protein [Streptomyces sp. NPDC050546]|uniref:hypothetical protein n=1 Tax=Streptomyces sp. NPDC050546 TaxID=3365628 RepID=UPI00379731BC
MAVLTVHHWSDPAAGIRELCRVARRRVVDLPEAAAFDDTRAVPVDRLARLGAGPVRRDVSEAVGGNPEALSVRSPVRP